MRFLLLLFAGLGVCAATAAAAIVVPVVHLVVAAGTFAAVAMLWCWRSSSLSNAVQGLLPSSYLGGGCAPCAPASAS